MSRARVVVVGAVNTDLVITAPHLPAAGETVVGSGMQTFGGGKGANAAVAASRAGATVLLIGAIGADAWGANALADLQGDGVDTSRVAILEDEPTGAALIVVDARGENQIALGPGANGAVTPAHVRAALANVLEPDDIVLVSSEIPLEAVAAALEAGATAGARCILNPAPVIPGLEALLDRSPILTPNAVETAELVRRLGGAAGAPGEEALHAELRVLAQRSRAAVVATLGSDGCAVHLPDGGTQRIPAHEAASVVDTTGAGDTFNGVLAARMAAGDELPAAARIAVLAASLSVSAHGARTGMPGAAMIEAALQGSEGIAAGA